MGIEGWLLFERVTQIMCTCNKNNTAEKERDKCDVRCQDWNVYLHDGRRSRNNLSLSYLWVHP
jgi:hypothetical protein